MVDIRGHLPEEDNEGNTHNSLHAKDDSSKEGEDKEHGVSSCGGECSCAGGCLPASICCGLLNASASCKVAAV